MKVDYIIVGFGLAGLAFARELETNNKTFIVFENESQFSSLVAGGFYNPVILRRFNKVWDVQKQLNVALPFYRDLGKKFQTTYDRKIDIHLIFSSKEEQLEWFKACEKPFLSQYMLPTIINNSNNKINAPFGFGKLENTGQINTKTLISDYRAYLSNKSLIKQETFNYKQLEFNNGKVSYESLSAKQIVFCEGFGLKQNPFFNNVPMKEAKGELITIHAPELKIDFMLKGAVFVLPLGNDLYKIGATFNWEDKTSLPTQKGKEELIEKLKTMISVDFSVINHVAGIRPTIKDRRPIIGIHPEHERLVILNGLGTRGVLLAPRMAKLLYQHLEHQTPLSKEISIDRFV